LPFIGQVFVPKHNVFSVLLVREKGK